MVKFSRAVSVLGVLCLMGSFGLAIERHSFDLVSGGAGLLGLILFLSILVRAEAANLKHYANVVLYALFVLGAISVAYLFASRYDARFDLTRHKLHTLSEGTRKYLQLLKKDAEIVVFDVDENPYRPLLDQYAAMTPRIRWSLHDPRQDPLFTREYDSVVTEKLIYIRHGEKTKRISLGELNENTVTNAIVEVTRERTIKVCFLAGHGELAFDSPPKGSSDPTPALGAFKDFLASRAMEVQELNLADRGFVPKDATLLILAGPSRDLLPAEAREIEAYLSSGGSLLVLFDLPRKTGQSVDYTNLTNLLRRFGIDDAEEVVVDMNGQRLHGHSLKIPVSWYNPKHPITAPLASGASSDLVIPLVRSLKIAEAAPKDLMVVPLIASSEESWTEAFTRLGSNQVSTPEHLATQPLGWAVQPDQSLKSARMGSRLVAYGSSELVKDDFIISHNTAALLMLNSVNWLTEQEDSIPVSRRIVEGTPLILGEAELRLLLILVVMAFPSIIFFGGLAYIRIYRKG